MPDRAWLPAAGAGRALTSMPVRPVSPDELLEQLAAAGAPDLLEVLANASGARGGLDGLIARVPCPRPRRRSRQCWALTPLTDLGLRPLTAELTGTSSPATLRAADDVPTSPPSCTA
jgi:hypothetical protein